MTAPTFVYLFKCHDITAAATDEAHLTFIKVGISQDPRKRGLQLQASMPLFVGIHWLSGPMMREAARRIEGGAHRIMTGAHVRGEWFQTRPDLAQWAIEQAAHAQHDSDYAIAVARLSYEFSTRHRFAGRDVSDGQNVIRGPWGQ